MARLSSECGDRPCFRFRPQPDVCRKLSQAFRRDLQAVILVLERSQRDVGSMLRAGKKCTSAPTRCEIGVRYCAWSACARAVRFSRQSGPRGVNRKPILRSESCCNIDCSSFHRSDWDLGNTNHLCRCYNRLHPGCSKLSYQVRHYNKLYWAGKPLPWDNIGTLLERSHISR
jgi:hypothetical protein